LANLYFFLTKIFRAREYANTHEWFRTKTRFDREAKANVKWPFSMAPHVWPLILIFSSCNWASPIWKASDRIVYSENNSEFYNIIFTESTTTLMKDSWFFFFFHPTRFIPWINLLHAQFLEDVVCAALVQQLQSYCSMSHQRQPSLQKAVDTHRGAHLKTNINLLM